MGKTLDKPLILPIIICLLIVLLGQVSMSQTINITTTGIVSFIDIYVDVEGVIDSTLCLAEAGLDLDAKRACMPNIEVIHIPTFNYCMSIFGNLVDCPKDPAYQVPFITEIAKDSMNTQIYFAWRKFIGFVKKEVGDEVTKWKYCDCGDATCIARRTAKGVRDAISLYYPVYWRDVYQAVTTYAPMALHWQNPSTAKGAVIAPFYDFEPKPEQYTNLVREPRDVLYYFSTKPIPYLPTELNEESGGLTDKEIRKVILQEATLFEYQQFGFTALWELYGKWNFQIVWTTRAGWCISGSFFGIPLISPTLYVVPAPLYVIKGFTDDVIVPEGYVIPRVSGEPLF